MNVHKRHSTLLGGRRQFQPQVRPATIELHDVQPLALHDHEPRPRPRTPTKYCLPGGARPNGARLSCGATFEHAQTYDSSNRRRRQLQAQVRPATIEPHDAHTLTLHDHEPRTLPRAPTELSSWVALGLTGRA